MKPSDRQWVAEQAAVIRAARIAARRGKARSDQHAHFAMLIAGARGNMRRTMAVTAICAGIDRRANVAERAALNGVSQRAIDLWRVRRDAADLKAHPFN